MRVYVNNKPVEILPGMTVKHALINSGLLKEIKAGKKVYDEWGNEIGLDGELSEGEKIFVKYEKIIKKWEKRCFQRVVNKSIINAKDVVTM